VRRFDLLFFTKIEIESTDKKVNCRNKEANNAGYDTKETPAKQAFPCWGVWGRVGGVAKTMLVFRRNELLYFFKSSILPSD